MEVNDDYQQIPVNSPVVDNSLGSLHYQLDNSQIIRDIVSTIKCEQEQIDEHGRVHLVRYANSKPMLNDKGISHVVAILKSRLTKIVILSNLNEQIIRRIVSDIHEDLTDNFLHNWEDYEIQNESSASIIIGVVTDTVYSTLCKGEHGAYLRTISTMHTIQEVQHNRHTQTPQAPVDNTGIIEKIRGRLTGR